ncbi:MAG: hypothetical protein WCW02_02580 [Candidatus Buchananbacteria bacterium]
MEKIKPKIAIIGLTSCEGCQFSMLDQGQKFLAWLTKVSLAEFRLLAETSKQNENYDIVFIEGNPITPANVELLQNLRKHCRWLVVIGNCAALGGVPEIKNYQLKKKTIHEVYKDIRGIANPIIKEVANFVKVDLVVPGCPIDGEEFMTIANKLIEGVLPKIAQQPVCNECQLRGYDCLLQQGEICLGPVTLAGCQAICLKSGQGCWGCRGLIKDSQKTHKTKNLMKKLLSQHSSEEISKVLEVFGVRDSLQVELIKESKKTKK